MLYVTHDVDEVLSVADEVALIEKGAAREVLSTDEFRQRQVLA